MVGQSGDNEAKSMCKKVCRADVRYEHGTCQCGLRDKMRDVSRDSRPPDLNLEPTE